MRRRLTSNLGLKVLAFFIAVFMWLIVVNILHRNAKIFKYLKQRFSMMSERNRSVMRIVFLNQDMTVKSAHFRNRKYADRSERTRCYRKYLPLRHICANLSVGGGLQTEERNIARRNISL